MRALAIFLAAAASAADWRAGDVLLAPGPPGSFDETAVKDPSVVHHGGRWHVFYTARGNGRYSIGYVSAVDLAGLAAAPRRQLRMLPDRKGYAAAPQVFFFRPQNRWYLVFQNTDSNYQPVYSTADRIDRPDGWSAPRPLVAKSDRSKWIDFWVICDAGRAYLFFTRNQREVQVTSAPLSAFPNGWNEPRTVFAPVHEAVHIYHVRSGGYTMLFEFAREDGQRAYGIARAPSPEGPWKQESGEFAAGARLHFPVGVPHWTDEVSHGELLRSGTDERMEIDPGAMRFLIQGLRTADHRGDYPSLPWRLGLIEMLQNE